MKAVLWPFTYKDMQASWAKQMVWLANSLKKFGCDVKLHPDFVCKGLEHFPKYDALTDQDADICVYNHTDESKIIGHVLPAKCNWFFKPTVPDEVHTTLDELGYGPYSSITYEKPDFEEGVIPFYFKRQIESWIESKICKWGNILKHETEVQEKDYYLVLGQCGGDSVVTQYDFGNYFTKLEQVITELVRVGDRPVVVKLHPFTDGREGTVNYKPGYLLSKSLKTKYEAISPKVKVYYGKASLHNFVEGARCVLLANSGAGFEVMMHGKPIIAWGLPEYHWITYDLRHLASLRNALTLDWFDRDLQDKYLYWYMEQYCFFDQSSCDKRVAELLKKSFKKHLHDPYA